MSRIVRSCAATEVRSDTIGNKLPMVGGACSALVGPVGSTLDERNAESLGRCLRAVAEETLKRISPADVRPNIVVVLTDDQRHDAVSPLYTPAVDRIASQGVRFTHGYAASPMCAPSRASVLTGQYAQTHGLHGVLDYVYDPYHPFDNDDTIASWLHDAGFATGFLGKYINMYHQANWARNGGQIADTVPAGWDEWVVPVHLVFDHPSALYYGYRVDDNGTVSEALPVAAQYYLTDVLRQRAVEFLRRHRDDPFFLLVAPTAPHDLGSGRPPIAAERHIGRFAEDPFLPSPNFLEPSLSEKPAWLSILRDRFRWSLQDIEDVRTGQLEAALAVDEMVGALSQELEKAGLTDNTIFVYLSDNGLHWGDQWSLAKGDLYEESARIPFVWRYPVENPVPEVRSEVVLNLDLAPTFVAAAGVAAGLAMEGQDLRATLRGAPRDCVLLEQHVAADVDRSFGARCSDGLKYIRTVDGLDRTTHEELYDLEADPYERNGSNLALRPEQAALLDEMRERLDALR